MPETSPPSVSRSTTSPMSYCRSSTMKSPEIVSRTRVCAPNPSATPAMPALRTSGPRLTLNPRRIVSPTISQAITTTIPPASETTVVSRRRRRPSVSSPVSLARRRYRRTYRPTTRLTTIAIAMEIATPIANLIHQSRVYGVRTWASSAMPKPPRALAARAPSPGGAGTRPTRTRRPGARSPRPRGPRRTRGPRPHPPPPRPPPHAAA